MYLLLGYLTIGLTLNSLVHSEKFYINPGTLDGKCTFKDIEYKPAGRDISTIDSITLAISPITKLQKNALENLAGKLKDVSNVGEQDANAFSAWKKLDNQKLHHAIEQLAKFAPKLASAFGIFGLIFSLIQTDVSTGIDEVRESMDKSFQDMTDKLNNKVGELKDYVDLRFIQYEQRKSSSNFASLQASWTQCLEIANSSPSEIAEIQECQESVVKAIIREDVNYMPYYEEKSSGTSLNSVQVKAVEALLKMFRSYVSLSITAINTVAISYKEQAFNYCRGYFKYQKSHQKYIKHVKKQVETIQNFKSYINWAIQQIATVHESRSTANRSHCEATLKCTERKPNSEKLFLYTVDRTTCSCLFDPILDKTKMCASTLTLRIDGKKNMPKFQNYRIFNAPTGKEALRVAVADTLFAANNRYVEAFDFYVQKYWKAELLTDSLDKIVNAADKDLEKLNKRCDQKKKKSKSVTKNDILESA